MSPEAEDVQSDNSQIVRINESLQDIKDSVAQVKETVNEIHETVKDLSEKLSSSEQNAKEVEDLVTNHESKKLEDISKVENEKSVID